MTHAILDKINQITLPVHEKFKVDLHNLLIFSSIFFFLNATRVALHDS